MSPSFSSTTAMFRRPLAQLRCSTARASSGTCCKVEAPDPRFRVTIASTDGKSVVSPYSLRLLPQVSIRSIKDTDLIVVPASGLDLESQFTRHAALLPWLRKQAGKGAHVAGTCAGAAYLAESGLLDGRLATTHWAIADDFHRRYPKVDWRPEQFVTEDRRSFVAAASTPRSTSVSILLRNSAVTRSRCNARRRCSSTCPEPINRATPSCRCRDRTTMTNSGPPKHT